MIRQCSLEDISDGRLYDANDMAKLDTCNCEGCHKCCSNMGESVVIDPYDFYLINKATGLDLESLIGDGYLELNIVDGLILPNLKMDGDCSFLDKEGRCSIHEYRPGICRLFPLGRYYNEDGFKYFVQKDECAKNNRAKVKISKWIDVEDFEKYEEFVLKWHKFIRHYGDFCIATDNTNDVNEIVNRILLYFYKFMPDEGANVFDHYMQQMENMLGVYLV